jgi:predicted nucleic acid-binding protein
MIKKVFFDTNIFLDLALSREPFRNSSKTVLAMAEANWLLGFTSSNCVADMYYLLRKNGGDGNTRYFLSGILKYITVIPIDHSMTLDALRSAFSDFEDAMQYGAAMRNRCDCIVTRNTADYKKSTIPVHTPDEFLRLYAVI